MAADTCVAMDEWVQNPTAHTALDDILPCVDSATAQETMLRSKEVTAQLVNLINEVITNVSNINFAANFVPMYFNQSGPLVPTLCNPFFPDLSDRACTAGEVNLNNATEVKITKTPPTLVHNYLIHQVSDEPIFKPFIYKLIFAGMGKLCLPGFTEWDLHHNGAFDPDVLQRDDYWS